MTIVAGLNLSDDFLFCVFRLSQLKKPVFFFFSVFFSTSTGNNTSSASSTAGNSFVTIAMGASGNGLF